MAPVINMVMMPVLLLSGILLPMTHRAALAAEVSDFMPFRWIVDGVRDLVRRATSPPSAVIWGTGLGARPVRPRHLVGHGDLPQGERLTRPAPGPPPGPGPAGLGRAGSGWVGCGWSASAAWAALHPPGVAR